MRMPYNRAKIGASFMVTPAQTLAEMNTTEAAIKLLDTDIQKQFVEPAKAAWELSLAEAAKAANGGAVDTDTIKRKLNIDPSIPLIAFQTAWVLAWMQFVSEWHKWYTSNQSWGERFWGWMDTYDKAQEYRKRVLEYRAQFEKLGGKASGPVPPKPLETNSPLPSIPWAPVIGIVAIIGAAIVIPKVWPKSQ